jgi:HD-GYP domain-containing protein (c-di-GMP phosphodiesterase class II)
VKRIDVKELIPGRLTTAEYFTEEGDLLIAAGVMVNDRLLDLLRRRNIYDIYIKEEEVPEENPEIEQLLAGIDARTQSSPPAPAADSAPRQGIMQGQQFASILKGEAGFNQLAQDKIALGFDTRLAESRCVDRPVGMPMRDSIRQIATRERTEEHKRMVIGVYDSVLNKTVSLLNSLAEGKRVDFVSVKTIVEQLLRAFILDRNFLIALAHSQKSESHIYHHSQNVCIYSLCIATAFGYNQRQVLDIGCGALLHDVGMLLVPQELCNKKGKFDRDEWYEVMKHPILGLHLLTRIERIPEWIPCMAYQCHERENGMGYPKQRFSRFIHNYAKICAVADMYEAFSSPRPYREAYIPYKALELVIKASRQGLVSGEFVKALVQYLSLFPIGSIVELSDRTIGKVIRSNPASPSKPGVCILIDEKGNRLTYGRAREEELSSNTDLSIMKAHPVEQFGIPWTTGF